jgi:Toluene-4-monooxygenase system protein B (TmoB)
MHIIIAGRRNTLRFPRQPNDGVLTMALFPIYGYFEGDFVPHLVAIDTDNSVAEVAQAVALHSVGRRIRRDPMAAGYETLVKGKVVRADRQFGDVSTEYGLAPLDFVTVRFAR